MKYLSSLFILFLGLSIQAQKETIELPKPKSSAWRGTIVPFNDGSYLIRVRDYGRKEIIFEYSAKGEFIQRSEVKATQPYFAFSENSPEYKMYTSCEFYDRDEKLSYEISYGDKQTEVTIVNTKHEVQQFKVKRRIEAEMNQFKNEGFIGKDGNAYGIFWNNKPGQNKKVVIVKFDTKSHEITHTIKTMNTGECVYFDFVGFKNGVPYFGGMRRKDGKQQIIVSLFEFRESELIFKEDIHLQVEDNIIQTYISNIMYNDIDETELSFIVGIGEKAGPMEIGERGIIYVNVKDDQKVENLEYWPEGIGIQKGVLTAGVFVGDSLERIIFKGSNAALLIGINTNEMEIELSEFAVTKWAGDLAKEHFWSLLMAPENYPQDLRELMASEIGFQFGSDKKLVDPICVEGYVNSLGFWIMAKLAGENNRQLEITKKQIE